MDKKIEGFWFSENSKEYHFPESSKNKDWEKDKEYFIEQLKFVEAHCNKYKYTKLYRGISKCRICNCFNGSSEYDFKNWIWPCGFLHYIEQHNIEPSNEFKKFIFNQYYIIKFNIG